MENLRGSENLELFFEKIKSLGFWQRIFGWRMIRALSYNAYDEFTNLTERLNALNKEILIKEERIKDLGRNIEQGREISSNRISDLTSSAQKLESKLLLLENEVSRLNKEKIDLSNRIARFEQVDQTRAEEFQKNVTAVKTIQKGLDDERTRLVEERLKEKEDYYEKIKLTWQNHEEAVNTAIRNICRAHLIEYVENVPFRGNPDNTVKIAGEYVIFDAKSPAGDELENFPKYLKIQTEAVKKYIRQENVKSDIFLVVPSNTLGVIGQFSFSMGDYNVYIISVDSLEPIIVSLKKIENYEFAEQLTPDERENICRIIGRFSHLAKRKIQVDYFFSYQFLDILTKCNIELPEDIIRSVKDFEKAEKLNPPQEKRAKQILTEDLLAESERLGAEVGTKVMEKTKTTDY